MSRASFAYAWRAAALAGLVVGLALVAPLELGKLVGLPVVAALAAVLAVARPRHGRPGTVPWLLLVLAVACLAGLAIGSARLTAIDQGRLLAPRGAQVELRGVIASAPRTSGELTRFALDTPLGRIAVETRGDPSLDEGAEILASGTVREPAPWVRAQIERSGASRVLAADRIEGTGGARGGLRGALDDVRRRAEMALERGTEPLAAALLRGFVLGQDDRIPEPVRDDFRRSGLAHVLAVSGQNVMLLAILATPLLALAGVPLRTRLVAIALIIAIYVPVAGAGASIQRAGVMGIAGVVASLASRPAARWYALGLAAAITLAIDPRATGDIGWQLSFCAVAGLLVLASPLVGLLAPDRSGMRRALAEGAAMTMAATLATAPLAAHHFGTVSLTALPANLIALPAIAPAMWLGMLSGALGQVPGAPVEPLSWLGGLCAGFIAWVAHALGPDWAQLDVPQPGPVVALAWTVVLVGGARLLCLALERRRAMGPAPRLPRRSAIAAAIAVPAAIAGIALLALSDGSGRPPALTIRILDVGQGDAILVQPRHDPPLLVDTGPPDGGAGERLAALGVDELAAIAITHDELDHSGGLAGVLQEVEPGHILTAYGSPRSCRYLDCPPTTRVAAGSRFRVGPARAEVLWPPPSAPPAADPNETALVVRLSLGDFDALLTADAEAEAASYASGPVELLKVAHHGSADSGLDALLERTSPQVAAISVGSGNTFGHPAPETTEKLEEHGVSVMRTDTDGEIVIQARGDGWGVR
jgi:competence protein ComEC